MVGRFCKKVGFKLEYNSEGVMDGESGEFMEEDEKTGIRIGQNGVRLSERK